LFENFKKIRGEATKHGKEPLLIWKRNNRLYETLHIISEKRHLELLQAERELKNKKRSEPLL